MDFGESTSRGPIRKTGRPHGVDTPQDPLYEYSLECAEQFEALPTRPELDDAIEQFAYSKTARYTQVAPVVLESGDLPRALADVFFFPDSPTIESAQLEVAQDKDGRQFIQGAFSVGSLRYAIGTGPKGIVISASNSEGGEMVYTTSRTTVLQLLATMYARSAVRMLERLHEKSLEINKEDTNFVDIPFAAPSQSEIKSVINDLVKDGAWENISEIFEKLATAVDTGTATFTTHAVFPPQDNTTGDRAILATKVDTYTPSTEQSQVGLDINWLLSTSNTELIGTVAYSNNASEPAPTPNVIVHPTDYNLENFAWMREFDAIAGNVSEGTKHSKESPEWLALVTVFMTTIKPYLHETVTEDDLEN